MEATATASSTRSQTVTSGSRTIADLVPCAAAVKDCGNRVAAPKASLTAASTVPS